MGVDLHIHSIASADGEYTPEQLVKMAKDMGLEAIAISDHDSVASVAEGIEWGKKHGVEVLPACEFSCVYKGKVLHIVGYYIDMQNKELQELFKKIEEDRKSIIDLQIQKLRYGGFFLEKEKVMEDCHHTTPVPGNYTNVIFADERNENNPIIKKYKQEPNAIMRFLLDFLVTGKPYYVPQFLPEALDIIGIIRKGGGVPILAHPGTCLTKEETPFIDELLDYGLVGLEVYTTQHDDEQEGYYLQYCQDKGIMFTCGSDFHGKFKPQIKMGDISNNDYSSVEKLKKERK